MKIEMTALLAPEWPTQQERTSLVLLISAILFKLKHAWGIDILIGDTEAV